MSFDPHAYRVALLESLTAGSTPPLSPERSTWQASAVPAAPSVFHTVGTLAPAGPPQRPPTSAAVVSPPDHRRDVVIENSTLSLSDHLGRGPAAGIDARGADRREYTKMQGRRGHDTPVQNGYRPDGLVQSHLLSTPHPAAVVPVDASTAAPSMRSSAFSILDESPRSLIADFVDRCISFGVPDDVIAEHVRFMMYSMKEIVTLHEALHARFQHDRVREYEINELTNVVEQQYMLATRQSHGHEASEGTSPLPVPPHEYRRDDAAEPARRSLSSVLRHASESPHQTRQRKARSVALSPSPAQPGAARATTHTTQPPHRRTTREQKGAGGGTDERQRSRLRSFDPYASLSSSSDIDLESLAREKMRAGESAPHHQPPRRRDTPPSRGKDTLAHHLHHSHVIGASARRCSCGQPHASFRSEETGGARYRREAQGETRPAMSRSRRPASRKPTGTSSPADRTPHFMAPTHLSRTREQLVEQSRRAADEEAAQAEARQVTERSPSRGSTDRRHRRRGSQVRGAGDDGRQVQWMPLRSTRASELRAAFISAKAQHNKHVEGGDEAAPANTSPMTGVSPHRAAPVPSATTSSAASSTRSTPRPPPPPPATAHDDGGKQEEARVARSLYTSSASLQLSPPPRFRQLKRAPCAAASSTATPGEGPHTSRWHRARTPTPPVQVTSPRLQIFLERGLQKVRESERVLTQTPPVSSLDTLSGTVPLPSRVDVAARGKSVSHDTTPTSPQAGKDGTLLESQDRGDRFRIHQLHRRADPTTAGQDSRAVALPASPHLVVNGPSEREHAFARAVDVHEPPACDDASAGNGQSPLVMISPTTSSSDRDEDGEGQRSLLVPAASVHGDNGDDESAPDQRWRQLYGTRV